MGNMSFVGPRPEQPRFVQKFEEDIPEYFRRHRVKAGLTGWAQVNGRNALSWKQKFEYDVWYVNNVSFALDFRIFWLTVRKVLKSEGISSETSATMEKFMGNKV